MPLPKSILCSSCKKKYPEGWRRCPYCGHGEGAQKLEAHSRRFMQQKLREWEQRFGKTREERPHPGERGGDRRKQATGRDRDQRPPGGKPQPPQGQRPQGQRAPAPEQTQPQPAVEGQRPGRRRRRRRGGGGGERPRQAGEKNQQISRQPQRPPQHPPQQPHPLRDPNAPNAAAGGSNRDAGATPSREGGGERPKRRRRFRRRRRGGGGQGGPVSPPSGD